MLMFDECLLLNTLLEPMSHEATGRRWTGSRPNLCQGEVVIRSLGLEYSTDLERVHRFECDVSLNTMARSAHYDVYVWD